MDKPWSGLEGKEKIINELFQVLVQSNISVGMAIDCLEHTKMAVLSSGSMSDGKCRFDEWSKLRFSRHKEF